MNDLIAKDKRNSDRIFPYIGGEEVNDDPSQAHHRFAICFENMSEEQARTWPSLMEIVERKVKPERLRQNREARARHWWRYGETAPALYRAIENLPRVLVTSYVGQHHAFAFLPNRMVYAITLSILATSSKAAFCVVQSRFHEAWVRLFGSSLEDRQRYTPTDCFEPFPFPRPMETNPSLERAGDEYYEFRANLMMQNNEGLTATYNRFHDPEETDPDILRLREMHEAMDRAVLHAYGWDNIPTTCEFLLDYEDEDEDEDDGRKRKRKKPWRYRWPDEVRDDVLARLLELNAKRAEEERLAGLAGESKPQRRGRGRPKRTKAELAAEKTADLSLPGEGGRGPE